MNRRVYETVARKRVCEGPLEPAEAELERQLGSKGWHTRGYLPHYDKPGTCWRPTCDWKWSGTWCAWHMRCAR